MNGADTSEVVDAFGEETKSALCCLRIVAVRPREALESTVLTRPSTAELAEFDRLLKLGRFARPLPSNRLPKS